MVIAYVKFFSFVLVHLFIIESAFPFLGILFEGDAVEDVLPSTVVLASMGYGMTDDYGPGPYHPDYQSVVNVQKAYFIKRMHNRWHDLRIGEKAIAFSLYMTGVQHAHLGGSRLFYAHRVQREKSLAEEVVIDKTAKDLEKMHAWLQAPTPAEFLARVEPGFLSETLVIRFKETGMMTYEEVETYVAQLCSL